MNKIFKLLIFSLLVFSVPFFINAEEYDAVITGSSVRIRSEASTSGKILFNVNSGTSIKVLDKTTITGAGCSNGWLKILYKEKQAYVCSSYVKYIDNTFNGINVLDWTARTSGNDVAVREKANASSKKVGSLTLGANVKILEEVDGNNSSCSSGKWYKIQYNGSKTGYMCKNYIVKKEDITLEDPTYAEILKEKGFPDSYIPYLNHLHSKYPNWNFIAKKTNHNFSAAVSSEEGKCYMQTTNDNYRTSSKPAEASSWFHVNSAVIAFYMDPRNWLTNSRIFMFEKLDYSAELENNYPNLVKAIFGSGKLADDKYTIPMVNAARTNKISPLAIASRIKLEVSANGSSSTSGGEFTFKGQTYSGYYNFFNIGAYEDTIDGVKVNSVLRGLLYAAKVIKRDGNPWNDIEVAITEGSKFLANGYITKGQGTIYYQKFNVSPDAYYTNFTHQYMTNIQAPATEGSSSYNSYKDSGLLNETFVFEIPVYNNMPAYTSLPGDGDTNNDLASLSVEGYNMSPTFDEDVLTYSVYVPTTTEKVNVLATAKSQVATVVGTGEILLEDDEKDVTITVTSETGNEKKYIVSIKKIDGNILPSEIIEASGLSLSDNIITKVQNGTTVNTFKSSFLANGATEVKFTNKDGNILNDTDLLTTLSKVTIVSPIETKEFIISVKGDTSGDGKITMLDLLQILKHINGDKLLQDASYYAGDTSDDNTITMLDLLKVLKHINGDKLL